MLSVNNYTQEYINSCRSKIDADIERYNHLVATARTEHVTNELLDAAIASFEPVFFNNLLLVLDGCFVHRSSDKGQQRGNPLNEVREMCRSILTSGGKTGKNDNIESDAASSALQYGAGDEIRLNETDFIKLSQAFFDEIESQFLKK